MIQANAKVEWVAYKKLDKVLTHQKPFSNKSGLRYTEESSSSANVSKEMKFVKVKEPVVAIPTIEKGSLRRNQRKISFKVTKGTTNSTLLSSLWNPRTH